MTAPLASGPAELQEFLPRSIPKTAITFVMKHASGNVATIRAFARLPEAPADGGRAAFVERAVEYLIHSVRSRFDKSVILNVRGLGWMVAKS